MRFRGLTPLLRHFIVVPRRQNARSPVPQHSLLVRFEAAYRILCNET